MKKHSKPARCLSEFYGCSLLCCDIGIYFETEIIRNTHKAPGNGCGLTLTLNIEITPASPYSSGLA